jgi:hypothetical protein
MQKSPEQKLSLRRSERLRFLWSIGVLFDGRNDNRSRTFKNHGLDRGRLGTLDDLAWWVRVREIARNQKYGIRLEGEKWTAE